MTPTRAATCCPRPAHVSDEVEALLAEHRSPTEVSATLGDFDAQSLRGSGLLLDSFADTRDPEVVAQVRAFTADQMASLARIAGTAPAEHQQDLARSASGLRRIDQRAAAACSTCDDGRPALRLPTELATAREADQALRALRQAPVDNSHPVLTDVTAPGNRGSSPGTPRSGSAGGGNGDSKGVPTDDGPGPGRGQDSKGSKSHGGAAAPRSRAPGSCAMRSTRSTRPPAGCSAGSATASARRSTGCFPATPTARSAPCCPDPAQWKTDLRRISSEYSVCWIVSRTWSVTLKTSIGSSAAPGS